jgi:acetolactate synthase-1/2/3 large subunit
MHGGDRIAEALEACGTSFLFTLCGGHISPILVGCKRRGIRVIDVRHEATAVFAADAVARLSGRPGVAAVTAGPGATNTVTAVKNAQLAQSPVVLLVGATATALKGRGALQDIDQAALLRPHLKWMTRARRVRDLAPAVVRAVEIARAGVPGPVAVECPVDLLYDEAVVRDWYRAKATAGRGVGERLLEWYMTRHVDRIFTRAGAADCPTPKPDDLEEPDSSRVQRAAKRLSRARRPLLLMGSQAMLAPDLVSEIRGAVERLGIPVYLSGMARGLLGAGHPLHLRHRRRDALREADGVVLAGVACDFRLGYGRHIRRDCHVVSANRSPRDLRLNRRPNIGVLGDAARFLVQLAGEGPAGGGSRDDWLQRLRQRDRERDDEIGARAAAATTLVNPLGLCKTIDGQLGDDTVLVGDGGDFVATASYIVRPRGPLTWLDPGAFGTLGVGAGFAIGAKLCRPDSDVWLFWGDGAAGYGLIEIDSFVRHGLPIIAVVGNDACWTQIKREQVEILKDDVGCVLRPTDYHVAARGLGGIGFRVDRNEDVESTLRQAVTEARRGSPVLVNAIIEPTDFRKGSISI